MSLVIRSDFDDFLQDVEKGMVGKNKFIPVGFPKLNQHIGLGRGIYILVGGEPGTGKTALTDEMFVLNPYEWYMVNRDNIDTKLRIIYRSMERSKKNKIAKWVCLKLWLDYNILIDVPTMLGWKVTSDPITADVYAKIKYCRDYFEEMFDVVQITDGAVNPTGMYKQCREISLAEGVLLKSNSSEIKIYNKHYPKGTLIKEISKEHYKITKGGTKVYYEEISLKGKTLFVPQYHTEYFPDDENIVNVVLADHNGKWKTERGYTAKQTLDKASQYFGELRDIYEWSPIAINQFNRNIADTTRRVKTDLAPEKQDFKGSGNMYEDADFVCAIFNPFESGLKTFKGYEVMGFKTAEGFNRFRTLHILKNSYGIDNITTGLTFIGENGHFIEVAKKPKEMTPEDYKLAARPELSPPNYNEKVTKYT